MRLQKTQIILLSVHGLIFQHLKLIIMMQFGLNVWSDEDSRNAGWEDWLANSAEDFEAAHNDTLDCQEDRVFHFTGTAGMTPSVEWTDEPPFNADYHFCTFADGENGIDELRPVMANFDAWVDGREKDSMWYVWHDPLFDTSN